MVIVESDDSRFNCPRHQLAKSISGHWDQLLAHLGWSVILIVGVHEDCARADQTEPRRGPEHMNLEVIC